MDPYWNYWELLKLGVLWIGLNLIILLCGGFLVRIWVHHRQPALEYDQLERWHRRLTYLRWGAYVLLFGSLLANFAGWPLAMIYLLFAFITVLLFAFRARSIVAVWMGQLKAGERLT
jgi:hypothetical protein